MRTLSRLQELGITRDWLCRMTAGPDTLFSPLRPTRELEYSDDPACVVARALFCAVPVSHDEFQQAWGEAIPSNLFEQRAGVIVCPYHIRLVRGLLLISDFVDSRSDAAMGAGQTTAVLYEASRPLSLVRRALDLGCGAGTLALLLARDAAHVVGTDINPRAVDIARRNAAMNQISNIDFRVGDLYEPVHGEQFDLIVSQPPYYPTPADGEPQVYLHGGSTGDEIARAVLGGISGHLAPGGTAFVFACLPVAREIVSIRGLQIQQQRMSNSEIPGTVQMLIKLKHEST